jgi:hypothetical protein
MVICEGGTLPVAQLDALRGLPQLEDLYLGMSCLYCGRA